MQRIAPSPFLLRVLLLDAASSGAMGLLLALGAGALGPIMHLPAGLLREVGVFLLGFAALVGAMATRQSLPRWLVLAVVAGNALWAVDSLLLLLAGWVAPNALGAAFVAGQALVVAALAGLEWLGLRRSAPALA